jgi:hypothetical protein
MLITITSRAQNNMEIPIPGSCTRYDSLGTPFQLQHIILDDSKTTMHQVEDIGIQVEGLDT